MIKVMGITGMEFAKTGATFFIYYFQFLICIFLEIPLNMYQILQHFIAISKN